MSEIKIILSPENWETKRQEGGEPLVAVEIAPRVSVKMRKSEAIAKGLYKEEGSRTAKDAKGTKDAKRKGPGRNKMRAPAEDKTDG